MGCGMAGRGLIAAGLRGGTGEIVGKSSGASLYGIMIVFYSAGQLNVVETKA